MMRGWAVHGVHVHGQTHLVMLVMSALGTRGEEHITHLDSPGHFCKRKKREVVG
jgi:hypothetical protein